VGFSGHQDTANLPLAKWSRATSSAAKMTGIIPFTNPVILGTFVG
jgi:hypothetical protein